MHGKQPAAAAEKNEGGMALHGATGTFGVAGLFATAFNYIGLISSPEAVVQLEHVLQPWNWSASDVDRTPPPCAWTGADTVYSSPMCTHFMIGRTPQDAISSARERALACASLASTSCVLSPEVGFSVPAVFVYDEEKGMKTLIAPRVDEQVGDANEVHVLHPVTEARLSTNALFDELLVETQVDSIRRLEQLRIEGEAAHCVQLLWLHYSTECNKNLA